MDLCIGYGSQSRKIVGIEPQLGKFYSIKTYSILWVLRTSQILWLTKITAYPQYGRLTTPDIIFFNIDNRLDNIRNLTGWIAIVYGTYN